MSMLTGNSIVTRLTCGACQATLAYRQAELQRTRIGYSIFAVVKTIEWIKNGGIAQSDAPVFNSPRLVQGR